MSNSITVSLITSQLLPELKKNGIDSLLPTHIKPETFARLAAVAIFNNPSLASADRASVINGLIMSARDGLLCDGREAALVPFNTKQNGKYITKAQYMPMVDGVLKRARQSGQVKFIDSKPVFANDEFDFWSDEDGDHFKHRPTLDNPGELVAVIACAKMNDGSVYMSLLRRWEIERAKASSKQGNNENGPWIKFYDRMACKTGLHRIARRLPNSSEIIEMLEMGDPKNWDKEVRNEREINPIQNERETSIEDVFNEPDTIASREIETPHTVDCEAGIDDILNYDVGMSKFEELVSEIKHTSTLGDLIEVGGYISQAKDCGEINEEEALSLKVEYQKRKNSL